MKICIIEDEPIWREMIQEVVEKYCRDSNISAQIGVYENGKETARYADADLLFLDIELGGSEDGFAIAESLMRSERQCKVCFLTSHTELARLGYRVNAFRYIDKKHLEEISEALDCFVKTKIQERTISLNDISGICRTVNLATLLLVETNGRKLRYLMQDGSEYFCDGRISETAQSLSQFGFFQVQRSYIVNLKFIEKVNGHEIVLSNGTNVVIGRTRSKEFKKEFFKWRMIFDN